MKPASVAFLIETDFAAPLAAMSTHDLLEWARQAERNRSGLAQSGTRRPNDAIMIQETEIRDLVAILARRRCEQEGICVPWLTMDLRLGQLIEEQEKALAGHGMRWTPPSWSSTVVEK